MISRQYVLDFINSHNYDVRESHNARWIDQKCTPDVLLIVADCVINYVSDNSGPFTRSDIWQSPYAEENIQNIFRKPSVNDEKASNEYDKFFSQPLELLAYAGVLIKHKTLPDGKSAGKYNYYTVADSDMLAFIASREHNTLFFLTTYIKKVLSDCALMDDFEKFFTEQTNEALKALRHSFFTFTHHNTPVKGDVECGRIFTKILNPLAFERALCGTSKGNLSKRSIGYNELMYNRDNFRDLLVNKPKGVTRKEYAPLQPSPDMCAYRQLLSIKSKRYLKDYNDEFRSSMTEHIDDIEKDGLGIHVHHIFPESVFPEISWFLENLIVITPTQHLTHAHPMGNTKVISPEYQQLLLISKINRIKENLDGHPASGLLLCEPGYEFRNLQIVLATGLDDDTFMDVAEGDFDRLIAMVNAHYQSA